MILKLFFMKLAHNHADHKMESLDHMVILIFLETIVLFFIAAVSFIHQLCTKAPISPYSHERFCCFSDIHHPNGYEVISLWF